MDIPSCPPGSSKMWDGYSLLFVMGNKRSHAQDLGESMSMEQLNILLGWGTTAGHVIGPTFHYDVTDFVFVAKRRDRAA